MSRSLVVHGFLLEYLSTIGTLVILMSILRFNVFSSHNTDKFLCEIPILLHILDTDRDQLKEKCLEML